MVLSLWILHDFITMRTLIDQYLSKNNYVDFQTLHYELY